MQLSGVVAMSAQKEGFTARQNSQTCTTDRLRVNQGSASRKRGGGDKFIPKFGRVEFNSCEIGGALVKT